MNPESNCSYVAELIIPFLDAELDREQTEAVQQHLNVCSNCRFLLQEHEQLWELLDELPQARPANIWPQVSAEKQKIVHRTQVIRWAYATAAAAILISSVSMLFFFSQPKEQQLPENDLLVNLDMVEEYSLLAEVGGADLIKNPEILNITFELSQQTFGIAQQ